MDTRFEHSAAYKAYLRSPAWHRTKLAALSRVKYLCEGCGYNGARSGLLQVHHLHYDDLGHEEPSSLMVVCPPCHIKEDAKRAGRTMIKRQARLAAARLDGWATKVYGEDWEWNASLTPEAIEQEFDEWLERKEREDTF